VRRLAIYLALFSGIIFLCSGLAYAGMGYHLKCDNCRAEAELYFGTGMVSKVVANGYCYNCKKYVCIRHGTAKDANGLYQKYDGSKWSTMTEEEIKAIEQPIGYVYCPDSEQKRALYPCPICGKPFIQIKEEDFGTIENPAKIYCPVCGKKALEGKGGILWD
jgi:DNA-directed RNA polymerase subunit RPC12/RpoP